MVSSWQFTKIHKFLEATSAFRHLLTPYLSVVALRDGDANVIVAARLTFASPTAGLSEKRFECRSIRALATVLPNLKRAEELLEAFARGELTIDQETFAFPPNPDAEITVEVDTLNQMAGIQTRSANLTMHGRSTSGFVNNDELQWDLKSASPPYLSFDELLHDFGAPIPQGAGVFEAVHALPLAIDGSGSRVQDGVATISIKAERGIPPEEIDIGLIAIKAGETAHRERLTGTSLVWSDDGQFSVASVERSIPAGRAVQASVSLKGRATHYWWLFNPNLVANPRTAAFDSIDENLSNLRDLMTPTKGAARDFEAAVSWLLWMLGFSVAHLGSNRFTQDAVDLIAVTPNGNFALVECTTGVISSEKKIPNLLRRRTLLLERLSRSKHNAIKVLPVLVTSCGRDEVEHEIEPAERRGVLVLTRDDLIELLNQTEMMTNADELYSRAQQKVSDAGSPPQGVMPGI